MIPAHSAAVSLPQIQSTFYYQTPFGFPIIGAALLFRLLSPEALAASALCPMRSAHMDAPFPYVIPNMGRNFLGMVKKFRMIEDTPLLLGGLELQFVSLAGHDTMADFHQVATHVLMVGAGDGQSLARLAGIDAHQECHVMADGLVFLAYHGLNHGGQGLQDVGLAGGGLASMLMAAD